MLDAILHLLVAIESRHPHRAFEFALDRWLDEGGRDEYFNDVAREHSTFSLTP